MAGQIYGFNQVFDSNGDPLPGAKLITRVPGTTTPKATYNAPDLLNPLTNPVIADSAGRFPQMWANTGENYDLVLTDENDVTIESFEEVTALGSEDQAVNIDFGTNGRFAIEGSDGVPNIEFGPPVGDDVGGSGRIGGWNGTQGDDLEIDFATVNYNGNIKTTGLIGTPTIAAGTPIALLKATVTPAASFTIALDQRFSRWQLVLDNVVMATAGSPTLVMSFDGGGTYKTGASDYMYQNLRQVNASVTAAGPTAAAAINLAGSNIGTDALGIYVINLFSTSTQETRFIAEYSALGPTAGTTGMGTTNGTTNNKAYGKVTNLRIATTAGNISCTYTLIGMP